MESKAAVLKETSIAKHIPYARFVDEQTIETKNGNLIQILKLEGLYAETLDDQLIDIEKQIRHTLLISLTDSSTSFYFHNVRKKINYLLPANYESLFLQTLHDKWQDKLKQNDFYINEHYITIVKKAPVGKIRRFSDLLASLSSRINEVERNHYRQETLKQLDLITKQISTTLAKYQPKKLVNIYDEDLHDYQSPGLSFLGYLLNLDDRNMMLPTQDMASVLPTKRLFFDKVSGILAIRDINNHSKYAAVLSIKHYSNATYAGMLDRLQDIKAEFIIAQTFNPIEKQVVRDKIKEEKRNSEQSDDGETSASDHISTVLNEMGSSEATVGEHTFSIICHAESLKKLEKNISDIDAVLNQIGLIAIREDVGIQPAFFATLPGNHGFTIRKALIKSSNMAGLASMHNVSIGKLNSNQWGDAITVLESISGSPYYFNFHVADVANTFMIGPMGSGKTLLESFLLGQSMKFGGRLIVFDKDRGLDIFIRAIGGSYSTLTAGKQTGFAPFQMEDTADNRYFLFKLLRKIAVSGGISINSSIDDRIKHAIDGAFTLPKPERVLRNIVSFLGMKQTSSLRSCFDHWIDDGHFAWIFDNETDELSLSHSALGFDMTSIFSDSDITSIIYYYLFHRIEMLLDGTPTRIVCAEGWLALQDAEFRKKIQDWSSTPRKKNAFLVIDTQAPNDIAQSEIGCKIIQESVTQIYFANEKAEYDHYVNRFKLTEKEYHIIKTLSKDSRFFLLKQGKNSVVVRCNMTEEFAEEISVLSGTTNTVKLLDHIRAEFGDKVTDWLPIFFQAIKDSRKAIC